MKTSKISFVMLVIFIMAIISVSHPVIAMEQATNYSHIKVGAQNFWSAYLTGFTATQKEAIKSWQASRLDIATGGANLLPYNSSTITGGYTDTVQVYAYHTYLVRNVAEAKGFVFEDMWLHSNENYQVLDSWKHSGMDRFDIGEVNANGFYSNGVFVLNGSTYTDKTTAAYDTTANDVIVADKLFIGYFEPFADINFVLSTVAVGKTVAADYWNGSTWTTLTPATDGTNGFTQSGLFNFIPPADWQRTAVNGSRVKWWVRFTVAGSGGTSPVASRIYGDNQLVTGDGVNNSRGWDAGSQTIVNTGELAYNPTPPLKAQAKFRHQARVTGMWSPNATYGNHSDVQKGVPTWATYMGEEAKRNLAILNKGGYMFDDGNADPGISSPSDILFAHTDGHTGFTAQMLTEARGASLEYAKNLIKASYPTVKVGSLVRTPYICYKLDWCQTEDAGYANNISSLIYNYSASTDLYGKYRLGFDSLLPFNNPNNTAGIMVIMDTYSTGIVDTAGTWYPWDRGNRSPILALAAYYIGANENTYFGYNIGGTNYTYYGSPGTYYYWSPTSTILTQAIPANSVAAKYDVYGEDFSGFPASGRVKIGDSVYKAYTKISNTQLRFGENGYKVYVAHLQGTKIQYSVEKNMALDVIPENVEFEAWGMWFPAIGVNVGSPIEVRNTTWKTWQEIGGTSYTSSGVWKRDYTNALILLRPSYSSSSAAQMNTYSNPIDLGGTYYPLFATGKTGAAITSIQLRTGEGAILMKAPIESNVPAPPPPTTPPPALPTAPKNLIKK